MAGWVLAAGGGGGTKPGGGGGGTMFCMNGRDGGAALV